MIKNLKLFLICIAIPVFTGIISGFLTGNSMESFQALNQPALSPPAWLFPVVWTILYILMGIASYFVITSGAPTEQIVSALKLYGLQLLVNFLWSFIFFLFQKYCLAFLWLVMLWILILFTMFEFSKISKKAGILLIPYLLWVSFAGYLNLTICLIN